MNPRQLDAKRTLLFWQRLYAPPPEKQKPSRGRSRIEGQGLLGEEENSATARSPQRGAA